MKRDFLGICFFVFSLLAFFSVVSANAHALTTGQEARAQKYADRYLAEIVSLVDDKRTPNTTDNARITYQERRVGEHKLVLIGAAESDCWRVSFRVHFSGKAYNGTYRSGYNAQRTVRFNAERLTCNGE